MLGPLLIFLCAILWGTGFVAQKSGAGHLGPFTVLLGRSICAAIFLYVSALVARGKGFTRTAIIGGSISGAALFLASLCQQIGIIDTIPGVSAFLTTNYILMVPIIGLFIGRRAGWPVWCGILGAIAGSYFICMTPGQGFSIGRGEAWTLLCAFLFAVQILLVDRFAQNVDILAFSCVQQLVCIVCSLPFLCLGSEMAHLNMIDLKLAFWPVVYLGVVSSGIAYTLQNFGQAHTPPALAAVLMSLESVFGAISGYVAFGDVLSVSQLCGCALVFGAALFVSLVRR